MAEEASAIRAGFALVFFSQALLRAEELADALHQHAPDLAYAGCSTAGEITPAGLEEGHVVAMLFPAESFTAVSTMMTGLSSAGMDDIAGKVEALKLSLRSRNGMARDGNVFALCFIDGLSYAEEAVTSAIHWGLDDIPLIGGSAGDDLKFETTTLISNAGIGSDCAIVVLIATEIPFHVFKTENFVPTEDKLVVTASDPERRIVYHGGILPAKRPNSPHMASRLKVEEILLGAVPDSVAFRASIVVGARSRPFRFLVRLVERTPPLVPGMALPRPRPSTRA